jgi:hypothetical protein
MLLSLGHTAPAHSTTNHYARSTNLSFVNIKPLHVPKQYIHGIKFTNIHMPENNSYSNSKVTLKINTTKVNTGTK